MNTLTVLAGIAWDPTIRGLLSVGVGVVVLMGSVWLLLGTNTGNRLGFFLAATGFFGWMAIMGSIWWIYGIGMLGQAPEWDIVEYNRGDLSNAQTETVRDIDLSALPTDDNGDPDYLLFNTLRADRPTSLYALAELRGETVAELLSPFAIDVPDIDRGLTDGLEGEELDEVNAFLDGELGGLSAAALDTLPDNIGGDWEFLSAANSKRGEAEATVSAELPACEVCDFGISAASDYILLDAYRIGGKPPRPSDSVIDRVTNKITNTLRVTHPPQYAVIQVRKVIPQTTQPGEAPPTPVADPDEPVISVVLLRDIGDRRFPAAMITIGSTIIFAILCWMLHRREELLESNVANAEAVAAGAG